MTESGKAELMSSIFRASLAEQAAMGRNLRSVWTVAAKPAMDGDGVRHFAAFPPDLVRRCVLAGCPAGGVVLDPFVGTGTTVRVAQALGRRGVGLELNPDYARLAQRNLSRGIELVAPAMGLGNGMIFGPLVSGSVVVSVTSMTVVTVLTAVSLAGVSE